MGLSVFYAFSVDIGMYTMVMIDHVPSERVPTPNKQKELQNYRGAVKEPE